MGRRFEVYVSSGTVGYWDCWGVMRIIIGYKWNILSTDRWRCYNCAALGGASNIHLYMNRYFSSNHFIHNYMLVANFVTYRHYLQIAQTRTGVYVVDILFICEHSRGTYFSLEREIAVGRYRYSITGCAEACALRSPGVARELCYKLE